MELGWVYFEPALEDKLTIVLRSKEGKDHPVDIAGKLSVGYSSANAEDLKPQLEKIFDTHDHLQRLADEVRLGKRKRFLSPILFKKLDTLPDYKTKTLCKAFQTVEAVIGEGKEAFQERLTAAGDMKLGLMYDLISYYLNNL